MEGNYDPSIRHLIVASTANRLAYLLVLRKRLQDRTGRAAAFLQYLHDFLQIRSVSSRTTAGSCAIHTRCSRHGRVRVMGYRPAYERYVSQTGRLYSIAFHRCGVLWSSNSAGIGIRGAWRNVAGSDPAIRCALEGQAREMNGSCGIPSFVSIRHPTASVDPVHDPPFTRAKNDS